ncbi:MAG: acyltransferase family protein, partial [Flavobacteriales bacterium]
MKGTKNQTLNHQPEKKSKPRLNRLSELDALRGIAALMVVLFHFTLERTESQLGFYLGNTGVELFFI